MSEATLVPTDSLMLNSWVVKFVGIYARRATYADRFADIICRPLQPAMPDTQYNPIIRCIVCLDGSSQTSATKNAKKRVKIRGPAEIRGLGGLFFNRRNIRGTMYFSAVNGIYGTPLNLLSLSFLHTGDNDNYTR